MSSSLAVAEPQRECPESCRSDLSRIRQLAAKYASQGPRYTSYPTAVEFSTSFDAKSWLTALEEAACTNENSWKETALYFHVPFCKWLCYFCACNKTILKGGREIVDSYLRAVKAELEAYHQRVPAGAAVTSFHWGGGSPGILTAKETEEMVAAAKAALPFSASAELSIELDPRTTPPDRMSHYRELGFTRVSIGVQDFDQRVQRAVNRLQSFRQTEDLILAARAADFASVNTDLIYGLPEQSLEGFESTIDRLLALRPDRIALYGYAHVTWLKKVQKTFNRLTLPTPHERLELFLLALSKLESAGYVSIGIDHFALPDDALARAYRAGKLERNFMGYTAEPSSHLIGVGASSISTLPRASAQNARDAGAYVAASKLHAIPVERGIACSDEDLLRRALIESLFCRGHIDITRVEQVHRFQFREKFAAIAPKLSEMEDDGLLTATPIRIALTDLGRLFTRNVAMLFDAYIALSSADGGPRFSATV